MPDLAAKVDQLTLEEKASLCLGSDFWHTAPVPRLGVESIMVSDGPHGLRAQLHEADHVGLGGSAPATCFPTAAALASSWDPELFAEVGAALAREARALGVAVVLGPGINIKRSPLCGRNFEYVSEDPWLAGELATAMVQGMQRLGVGASVKHFAANNQEADRLRVSADVDERTLREIYLPAFERVVSQAQPWTVMCAYNKVNGTYASENRWLLTDVLRDEWGFDGLVVSDWGAVHDRVAALAAGLDLEMPPDLGVSGAAIVDAVRSGALAEQALDTAVTRVLQLVERSRAAGNDQGSVDFDKHHALARRAAERSAVLLKNDGGVLPLRPRPGTTLAVIGEFARTPRYQGAGSSQVNATQVDVPLDELRAVVGPDATVAYAAGFTLDGVPDPELVAEAVATARGADSVVVFLGLPSWAESEGFDRADLDLPADQLALLDAVTAVHDRVVVMLANGSAVRMSTWDATVAAVLECWLSGQAAGGAVADLLLGRANPSGKLAETLPLRLEDVPSYLNFPGDPGHVRYGEGIFVGYRGHDRLRQEVSYPFGFGLSYSTFEITDVLVSTDGSVADGDFDVTVSAAVTNTSEIAGAEVVQVYVGDPVARVARPDRELKAFARVNLEPGESRQVELHLDARSFAFWSTELDRWAVEAGEFEIAVGTSSRDLAHRTSISLDAPSIVPPLTDFSTLEEWLADSKARALLEPLDLRPLADEELLRVIATVPMRTLAAFPGMGLDHATLDDLVRQL